MSVDAIKAIDNRLLSWQHDLQRHKEEIYRIVATDEDGGLSEDTFKRMLAGAIERRNRAAAVVVELTALRREVQP